MTVLHLHDDAREASLSVIDPFLVFAREGRRGNQRLVMRAAGTLNAVAGFLCGAFAAIFCALRSRRAEVVRLENACVPSPARVAILGLSGSDDLS